MHVIIVFIPVGTGFPTHKQHTGTAYCQSNTCDYQKESNLSVQEYELGPVRYSS